MLEKMVIRNFQVHAAQEILFDERITTIVGSSDKGKSAIIRALKWLCTNRPSGDQFTTTGQTRTSVRLFVDGHKITRRRGRGNIYDLDGKVFKAFGNDVPAAVSHLLNVGDVNFQGQHDAPYWLSETPGQVSRSLNAIINLGVIDRSLAHVASGLRRAAGAVDLTRERLKTAKADRGALGWVPGFVSALSQLSAQKEALRAKRARIDGIASALEGLVKAGQARQDAVRAVTDGHRLWVSARCWRVAGKRISRLDGLLCDFKYHKDKRCALKSETETMEIRLKKMRVGVCPVCGQMMS